MGTNEEYTASPGNDNMRPIEKHWLSRMNSIFQPVDLCLLSPAVSAYTAAWSVLVPFWLQQLLKDFQSEGVPP